MGQPKAPSVRKGGKEEWSPVPSVLLCAPGRIYCQSDHPHHRKASSTSKPCENQICGWVKPHCLIWVVTCLRYCFFKRFVSAGIRAHASPLMSPWLLLWLYSPRLVSPVSGPSHGLLPGSLSLLPFFLLTLLCSQRGSREMHIRVRSRVICRATAWNLW